MKKRKKEYNFVLMVLGLVFVIVPLFINKLTVIRMLMSLIGILIITLFFKQKDFKKNIIIYIVLLIVTVFIDSIIAANFIRIPIYTYNIVTIGNTRVYNSIGYRIWQCDINSTDNMKVDKFYTKGYICDARNIEQMDSNSFLNSVIENYDDYHNSYVKIRGKISGKNGRTSVEMQPYEQNNITINGYVSFADNITLKVLFKNAVSELDLYDIYDEITVIGIVKTLEHKDEKFTIFLSEAEMISDESFDKYEIIVNEENECNTDNNIIFSGEDKDIYTYCLDDITIKYSNNNYELSAALSSSKITIESLFENEESQTTDEEGNTLYTFKNYNIIECNKEKSKDIIIGPKSMKINSTTCSITEESPTE